MKQFKLSFLLFVLMSMLSNKAAAHDAEIDGIYYNFSGDEATVTFKGYDYDSYTDEYSGDIVIPETVNYNYYTYTVTRIGGEAFYNCSGLYSIKIPSSVTDIANTAFNGCSCLWSITVESGNTVYDSRNGCNAIIETSSNTLIAGCENTVIPNSVTSIGEYAFWDCYNLYSIEIPSSVTSIGTYAFYDCQNLTSIKIPSSVTSIGRNAFYRCSNLRKIIVNDIAAWCNIQFTGNESNPLYYVHHLYSDENTEITKLTIPNGVTSIGQYAFDGCSSLTSIEIPGSVTSIGANAFEGCTGLQKVIVNDIAAWCNIQFANSESNPLYYAYHLYSDEDTEISNFTIPSWVTSIGQYAFDCCSNLIMIILLPEAPPTVASNSFPSNTLFVVPNASFNDYKNSEGWDNWKERICPNDVAFTDITVAAKNDRSDIHTVIGESNLESVVSLKLTGSINGYDVMILRDKMPNIRYLDLTDASIVASNYEYYTGYTQTYDNVLPVYMFGDQSKWVEVKLPSTLVSIGNKAFLGTKITSIDFPAGIKSIGSESFRSSSIKSVDLSNSSIESVGNNAFLGCSNLTTVDLSNSSIQSIGSSAFSSCGNLASVDFSNSAIQSIGGSAFSSCGKLASVDFSSLAIQSIGNQAFYSCGNLTSVNLSNSSIQSIGSKAFQSCNNLASVNLTGCNKLTTISNNAFASTNVASIRIPQSLQTIGSEAFSSCNSLNDVYVQTVIPRTINSNTFTNASNATLHVPSLSYYNYYWATAWSQFKKIVEDTNPDYFYVDDDLTVESGRATDSPVDADITGTSGIVVQDDNQTFDEVTVTNNGTNSGTLITENNTTINIINLNITVVKNKWQFLSFPYRVKLTDVVAPGFYVFRRYDGAQRASTGGTGWASLAQETEYLEPGVGYIFQSSQSGTLGIRSENPDLAWGTGKTNPLSVYATDNIEHASWNFVGNPMLCYYDIDDLHTTAPLTFWNGSSYVARRPGDDNYQLRPFEAFFLQKPDGLEQLTYDKSGRMTYKQAQEHHNNKNNSARAAERSQRFLINLSLTQGQWEDEARVVYNNKKTTAYEPDCDAAKFMSTMSVPQLYAIEGNVQMAIDERPWGEVQLGFIATAEGEHTITATRLGTKVLLRDNLLNITHDLSLGGYTFTTEAGTFNDRFTLVPEAETTGIDATLNEKGQMMNDKAVFDLQGRRTTDAAQKGVRIVRKNHETRKIVK